ncbi:hypothetical protein LF1_08970 [Rubripirellula obstinata]|uniref:IrrE N-terminal-like domain-containing protein n=1 Tax=Rubripirellula obstinata TaxID=406547 RepID=A0A5B1CB44_9BACT|nr:ImmA/IrrE family metallo-endopeptidase [Rubripirellula obstinata]KAA1258378.1 hypothetical protein LF1_08970 [Rubripirellula obstinata]
MPNYVEVEPRILEWAVERSGLLADDFRQPVGDWIAGNMQPTYRKLEDFAKKARVPFAYLFLTEPPEETLPVPDYRTRDDEGVRRPSPDLIETIFEMEDRQVWMREYLLENGVEKLPFVGQFTVQDDVPDIVQSIRRYLKWDTDWTRGLSGSEDALRRLRGLIEEAGILIFINGVVGNDPTRSLAPDEFQGFVLIDDFAPLVFVNGADVKAAQLFTVAHEIAHVWLGQGAIFDEDNLFDPTDELEIKCNKIAAELLVPAERFTSLWRDQPLEDAFGSLSREFNVSPIVIGRRALELGLVNQRVFFRFYNDYMERLPAKKKSSGGNFYLNQNTRLGGRFGRAVVTAVREGRLSYTDAYSLTRMRGKTFDRYSKNLLQGGSE